MDQKAFARQISSYIDFNTIRNTLVSYDEDKNGALEESVSFLGSPSLTNAEDWGVYYLLNEFLEEFIIPEESIDLVLKIDGEKTYSEEAVSWLKSYQFSGRLIENLDVSSLDLPFKPLVIILAESSIIDILHCPTNFIISNVENLSATWREIEKFEARVFLEPNSPSELFVYFEQRVSSHYKYMENRNPGESAGNSVFHGYRYVCLTHELNIDLDLLDLTEKSAIDQANSTL